MTQTCKRIISWKQILQVRVGLASTDSTDWPARRLLEWRSPWLTSTENNSLQCTIISRWGTYFILSEQYHYDAFLLFDLKYFESLPPKSLHHLIIRVDDTSTNAPTAKCTFWIKEGQVGWPMIPFSSVGIHMWQTQICWWRYWWCAGWQNLWGYQGSQPILKS